MLDSRPNGVSIVQAHPGVVPDDPTIANGRYRLLYELGSSDMASVWRAHDGMLDCDRAIKILQPALAAKHKLRLRFDTEARTMAKLSHPNIVTIHDIGCDGDKPYIVMELLDGGSALGWLERHGPMPARLALALMLPVLAALQTAHHRGLMHRDVKPHNLMLDSRGAAKVTDFGIAQVRTEASAHLSRTDTYLAPEQRQSAKAADARSDVYGAAATLYTLVTGREPTDLHATVAHDARLPPALAEIVRRGTCLRPEDRYPTAQALADALQRALPDLPPIPPGTPPLGEVILSTLRTSAPSSLHSWDTPPAPVEDGRTVPNAPSRDVGPKRSAPTAPKAPSFSVPAAPPRRASPTFVEDLVQIPDAPPPELLQRRSGGFDSGTFSPPITVATISTGAPTPAPTPPPEPPRPRAPTTAAPTTPPESFDEPTAEATPDDPTAEITRDRAVPTAPATPIPPTAPPPVVATPTTSRGLPVAAIGVGVAILLLLVAVLVAFGTGMVGGTGRVPAPTAVPAAAPAKPTPLPPEPAIVTPVSAPETLPPETVPPETAPPPVPPAPVASEIAPVAPTPPPAALVVAPPAPIATPAPTPPAPTAPVAPPEIAPATAATPEPPPPVTPKNVSLYIDSRPSSLVSIDGNPVGGTPVNAVSVQPGPHTIKFRTTDGASRSLTLDVAGAEMRYCYDLVAQGPC